MKRVLFTSAMLSLALVAAAPAFAQRGGRGGGPPAGSPSSGAPGMSSTHGNSSSNSNTTKGSSSDAGKKTPDELLSQNTKLSDKLGKLLPKGITPQQACQNFRNLGQCVAAIHVAHNLRIDFNSLACDMTLKPVAGTTCPAGTGTGTKGMSLGQSIDALKPPGTDGKSESKKATAQAKDDMRGSG
jgi:hypothetical protein